MESVPKRSNPAKSARYFNNKKTGKLERHRNERIGTLQSTTVCPCFQTKSITHLVDQAKRAKVKRTFRLINAEFVVSSQVLVPSGGWPNVAKLDA
jgi:hypothetical protein